ncbi:hypothetical protein KFK09_015466 [Dendrobium nobile]|uniref:TBC1 domain family member 15 n=1 Tax=Dendrobium nobile TaxID=94219 RepID=A0A8T3B4W1_DENNO|nr:hypothetical protein KFK09_015466 [Dendrobium nobile]
MELHDLCDDPYYAASQRQVEAIDPSESNPLLDSASNLSCDSDQMRDANEFELVYSKENVAIHPSQYASERIIGRLRIIKQSSSLFLTWIPYRTASNLVGTAGRNLSSNVSEKDMNLYTIKSVPLTSIHSIRRHIPTIGWQYIIVILSSGLAFPPLYFYNGGVREFFAILKQHVFIVRSADDANVFRLNDFQDSLQKSLSSLELPRVLSVANGATLHHSPSAVSAIDNSKRENGIASGGVSTASKHSGKKKYKVPDPAHDLSVQVLEKFSLVTKLARDATTQIFREIQDTRSPLRDKKLQNSPSPVTTVSQLDNRTNNNTRTKPDDIEGISVDSKSVRSYVRGKKMKLPLTHEEWRAFLGREGRIVDSTTLRKRIFYGGMENDLRKEVWKFLLGSYEYDSTFAEREYLDSVKKSEYESLKSQWKSISETQARRFTKFRERKGLIEKDVIRTDRSIPYYEGDGNPNVTILRDILLTYSFYNFDLGYCQGMSDLLSPILFVIRDESDAFWSFVALMERLGPNFNRDQSGMHTQLFALMKLVELLDHPLHEYLGKADCLNYFFCFRWILIQFKREFNYKEIMQLWEVLWTHHLSEHFHLYICVAILKTHREKIIGEEMDFDSILKFVNGLSGKIDLDAVISDAEALCISAGEHGAACIPPGTPPSLPLDSDAQLYAQQDDEIL